MSNRQWKKIKGFPNYAISNYGEVCRADYFYPGVTPKNRYNKFQLIKPYYSERDNVTYVNLFHHGKKKLRMLHKLVAEHFIRDIKDGYVAVCKNGDYRNCQLGNIEMIPRGDAFKFKRTVFSDSRYEDFYDIFVMDPRPDVFYQMPIDVQEYLVNRGVATWQPRMLEFQNDSTRN